MNAPSLPIFSISRDAPGPVFSISPKCPSSLPTLAASAEGRKLYSDGVSFGNVAPKRPEEMAELRTRHA